MHIVCQHMGAMNHEKKEVLIKHYSKVFSFYQEEQEGWNDDQWITCSGITLITMWNEEHIYNNLRLAMIKEMMGMGPKKYCIVNNWMLDIESKLLLLVHFLPHEKFSVHPPMEVLRGPFLCSLWQEIGEAIRSRLIDLRNPFTRTALHSAQYVSFLKTGVYGRSSWF